MFKGIFFDTLLTRNIDTSKIESLWQEISEAYTDAGRYYHNLSHLDHITLQLVNLKDEFIDWETVVYSIAYHDIIYNTTQHNNEEESAKFAIKRLMYLGISLKQAESCKQQILATKTHDLSDPDTNLFTDADLSILGSERNIYLTYAQQVRKEYQQYPENIYNQGRKDVLTRFLKKEYIFKTIHFQRKYEYKARKNIELELEMLV